MIETNLAIEISNLQSDVCGGAVGRQELLERLSAIKNKSIMTNQDQDQPSIDDIVEGYRMAAIEQLHELLALSSSTIEAGEIPAMKLVHLVCCAELFTARTMKFFRARNDAGTRRMLAEFNRKKCQAEVRYGQEG